MHALFGAEPVGRALMRTGVRTFFVASSEEGASLRKALGSEPVINIFSGHMLGDTQMISDMGLTPMINSPDQLQRHLTSLPNHPFGVQLDTGMNRLGLEPVEWSAVRELVIQKSPTLLMSHLACADEPSDEMNKSQLASFHQMTDGLSAPKGLSNTGGILLGKDYHFDLARPGIGLYGGLPFSNAQPVVQVSVPVIQCRNIVPGECVGYGKSFVADSPRRIATVAAGYADGIIRAIGSKAALYFGDQACQITGRISMDIIGVDITGLEDGNPQKLDLLSPHQSIDKLAEASGTIGYEILTSLSSRYSRRYISE